MQSSEYEDILGSMQKIVREAYNLGRAEALQQVVEVLKTDPVPPKPLALAAPMPSIKPERAEPVHAEVAHGAPPDAMPDATMDVLATPAKAPDAPPREEKAPSRPWWSR